MAIEVVWEQLLGRGMEHLLLREGTSVEADGVAVGILKDLAYRINYRVLCDPGWNVQQFQVQNMPGSDRLSLKRRGEEWLDEEGRVQTALRGCTEVDIMITPFTNTLPIRRLRLQPGKAAHIAAVYVSVPELNVSRAEQIYTYLQSGPDGGVVRYESRTTGFTADLRVDADQLVTDYPGVFRRVWKKSQP